MLRYLIAIALMAIVALGLENDIFLATITGALSNLGSANLADLRDSVVAATRATLSNAEAVHVSAAVTQTTLDLELAVITTTAQTQTRFDALASQISLIQHAASSSDVVSAVQARVASAGGALTLTSSSGLYSCRSTTAGLCTAGGEARLNFSVQFGVSLTNTQLLQKMCDSMDLEATPGFPCTEIVILSASNSGGQTVGSLQLQGVARPMQRFVEYTVRRAREKHFVFASVDIKRLDITARNGMTVNLYESTQVSLYEANFYNGRQNVPCDITDYWWVITFIAIIPLALIVLRGVYYHARSTGMEKEREKIEKEHERWGEYQMQGYPTAAQVPLPPQQQYQEKPIQRPPPIQNFAAAQQHQYNGVTYPSRDGSQHGSPATPGQQSVAATS